MLVSSVLVVTFICIWKLGLKNGRKSQTDRHLRDFVSKQNAKLSQRVFAALTILNPRDVSLSSSTILRNFSKIYKMLNYEMYQIPLFLEIL